MKTKFHIILSSMIIMSLSYISCSNNSTGSDGSSGSEFGQASFTVSGNIEANHEGIANFRSFEMRGIHTWDILIMDLENRNFEISFSFMPGSEPIPRPENGTYDIGIPSATTFGATYSDRSSSESRSFTANSTNTGTLTITRSTDDVIEGTFEFTAIDFNTEEQITVSDGTFTAVPRVGGID